MPIGVHRVQHPLQAKIDEIIGILLQGSGFLKHTTGKVNAENERDSFRGLRSGFHSFLSLTEEKMKGKNNVRNVCDMILFDNITPLKLRLSDGIRAVISVLFSGAQSCYTKKVS
jgi:hypothetical protein